MVEAPQDIARYYRTLRVYVENLPRYNHRISMSIQKLSKFSVNHLKELSCDIFDEINRRRESPDGGHLPPRADIHQKRNNARYQFGDLSAQRFGEMCLDVIAELDRRYPSLRSGSTSVPVPEIPPLHRTRTLGKSTASLASNSTSGLSIPKPPESAPIQNKINVKETEVLPTKSTMVMEESDEDDSLSEYEYYNPDLSDTVSAGNSTRQNSTASTHVTNNKALSTSSMISSSSQGRTPFEERLAASSNLGFSNPSTSDFHFGVEEQLIDSRSSRLPSRLPSNATDKNNLDELNGIDRTSQATMRSPVVEGTPKFQTLVEENSSPSTNLTVTSPEGVDVDVDRASFGSMARSFVSNESLGSLALGEPEPDLVEYVNKLEDQVKELEQVNSQTIEENQQLHNMLADTENERKQIAQEVETLRLSSNQSQDRSITPEVHESLQEQLNEAHAKIKSLEAQLAELLNQHQDLQTEHEQLKVQRDGEAGGDTIDSKQDDLEAQLRDLRLEHEQLQTTHSQLLSTHDNLQETHRGLESNHNELQETHHGIKSILENFQNEHAELQAKNADLVAKQSEFEADPALNVATLKAEHESLITRHGELENKHSALNTEHRSVKQDYDTLQEAFMDLQTRYANLQNEQVTQAPVGLNIRNLGSSEEYESLLQEHNTLLQDLDRQREITEQVRQEAQRFLSEMRQMTESRPNSRLTSMQQDLTAAEQQVAYWKSRYQKSVDEAKTTRTQHRESMLLQPTTVSEAFFEADGLISGDAVEKYQDSITELLQATRSTPERILEYLHFTILATEELLGEISADDTRYAKQTRLVIRTGNQLISSVRNFSESAPLFPVAVVAAACSDLSYAVCELLKLAKVRPEEFLKYKPKSSSPVKNINTKQIQGNEFPRPPYSPDIPNGHIPPILKNGSHHRSSELKNEVSTVDSDEEDTSHASIPRKSPLGTPKKPSSPNASSKRLSQVQRSPAKSPAKPKRTSVNSARSSIHSSPAKEAVYSVESKLESARSSHGAQYVNEVNGKLNNISEPRTLQPSPSHFGIGIGGGDRSVYATPAETPSNLHGFSTQQQYAPYDLNHAGSPTRGSSKLNGAEFSPSLQDPNRTADNSFSDYTLETARAVQTSPVRTVNTVENVVEASPIPVQVFSHSPVTEGSEVSQSMKKPLVVDTSLGSAMNPKAIPLTPDTPELASAPTMDSKTPQRTVETDDSSPITPKIRRNNDAQINADSTVAELQAYLEEQTSETVDSIRELLSGIKVDAVVAELKPRVDSIVYYVDLMVTTTGACMKRTENWLLKDKGSFILQNLDDCCRRMSSLRGNLDECDPDDVASRQLKQRLAGVSFDMAKCTKELVKTVEDVSLKNELESIDARLQGAN